MQLLALATAVPPQSWSQAECWQSLSAAPAIRELKPRSIAMLEKVLLGSNGIDSRHFCTDRLEDVFDRNAQGLSETYEREARKLGNTALRDAMAQAESPTLDALFVCTCTGYLCPGLSSHIAEELDLPSHCFLSDNTGAGCGAAIPTLRAASNYLAAHPTHRVGVVAVEVCSAAFYISDDPGVLISLCLFGDGAAAVVLGGEKEAGWQMDTFTTVHLPAEREKIRFVNREGKLCNQLHRAVPEIAARAVKDLYTQTGHGAPIITHTGGRDVLAAIRDQLPDHPLTESTEVLRTRGNMSSPSVLHALELALSQNGQTPDGLWLVSFGAGFSAHSCRLHRYPES